MLWLGRWDCRFRREGKGWGVQVRVGMLMRCRWGLVGRGRGR